VKTSLQGFALIKQFEGFRADAYQDVVGMWTIGYGFTSGVRPGQHMTPAQADARLGTELLRYEDAVVQACTVPPNQNQFDALVCFAWNVGTAGMAGSSVIKAHNRGDFQSAARAFGLWNKAGGKVWPGLTRRRAAESALYLKPVPVPQQPPPQPVGRPDEPAQPPAPPAQAMPQAVEPESRLTESPINRAATVAGTTAATVGAVSQIKSSMDALQGWIVPLLCVAVVALAGYIVWQRWQQRRQGWA
jgi:lysozyme